MYINQNITRKNADPRRKYLGPPNSDFPNIIKFRLTISNKNVKKFMKINNKIGNFCVVSVLKIKLVPLKRFKII